MKLVILASGNGSNLQAVIDSHLAVDIAGVVCNKKDAFAAERAKAAGIPTVFLPRGDLNRVEYDALLANVVSAFRPDYVFLLGWMRILTDGFVKHFKVVNLHPALPGCFSGTGAIERQFAAFRSGKINECGIMTHYVIDEGVDSGPVILKRNVDLLPSDSLDDFEERVHDTEHSLVIETIDLLLKDFY
ncbi:MAG: phosphoribosylglycinamide formyltransferase [Treponema sp.]|nr:MAG: phosphoribosylglycinamide formyltransferase [Treponema sp.]